MGNCIGNFGGNPTNIDNFGELFIIWHNLWVENEQMFVYNIHSNTYLSAKGKTKWENMTNGNNYRIKEEG